MNKPNLQGKKSKKKNQRKAKYMSARNYNNTKQAY